MAILLHASSSLPGGNRPQENAKPEHPPAALVALAKRFQMAGEPTRAYVLLLLGEGEQAAGALGEAVGCSQEVLSGHLAMLRLVGLVEARREGRRQIYSLTGAGRALASAVATLGR